ncbi:MAG: thiosulfate oxidation carrier protein SoxY [Comamonas sp.]|nr:thiosulfate oxidation carrier protein SoxY [Comamonas sp.]HRL40057.1 thiosulfate oxidation carrier protein SoxY [Comamonas denitrificans]HRL97674.1 thiosulfate oxidation carrier protein SoxY [Comamonas denitrificans]HRM65964.1 thiosulfate oxidation carrier protein SoxY [Comamonas denitrificans]
MTPASPHLTRRVVVGAVATLALPSVALAQTPPTNPPLVGPLAPDPVAFKKALSTFTGSATPQAEGLQLDIPVLADNPSAVPIKAKVTLPITEHDWCEELIVLAELNPIPLACRIRFTAETGSAEAAVRIRLSQSQAVHVLARMKSGKLLAGKQTITVAASGCGM